MFLHKDTHCLELGVKRNLSAWIFGKSVVLFARASLERAVITLPNLSLPLIATILSLTSPNVMH